MWENMKDFIIKHKEAVRIVIFMGGLFIVLMVLSMLIRPESGEVYNITAVRMKNEVVAKERPESMDVLFVGNSESYRSFSPLQLYRDHGAASYNLGASALRLCDSREILSETLKVQSPKLVILETDAVFEEAGAYRDEKAKFTNLMEEKFPLFHYHIFYKSYLPESVKSKDVYYSDAEVFKGFLVETMVRPYEGGDYMNEDAPKVKMPEENERILRDIMNICKEQNVEFLLVSAPSATNWNKGKHRVVENWAEKWDVKYLDLNQKLDEIGIDWMTDTMDNGNHVNFEGSVKVMDYLGGYLYENYDLPDHRNEIFYIDWDKNLDKAVLYS
ncbi:hypothetical protein SAMN06296386_10343 [Lachnospiraceae bacterium]|nr:hypothetical protein SAMN06296386_10343 [Lachnospiraceae bacterium]